MKNYLNNKELIEGRYPVKQFEKKSNNTKELEEKIKSTL